MLVDLVKTQTSDGLRLDGVLYRGGNEPATPIADAAILIHGVGGNFYGSTLFDALVEPLRSRSVAVLRINTRGRDGLFTAATAQGARRLGAAYEIVDECRLDLAAWRAFLVNAGFSRIALVGHSLGAVKAIYAAADAPDDFVRLAALSPPRLSYRLFYETGDPTFRETLALAEALVEEGRASELIQARFPFPLVISAGAYVDKYGRGERYDILRYVPQICCPALFTYGEIELAEGKPPFAGIDRAVSEAARNGQQLEVRVVSEADHFYNGVQEPTAEQVAQWLTAL